MKKRYTRGLATAMIVMIFLFIGGCKIGEQRTEPENEKTIVIGAPYFTVSFFWKLAEELGYFDEGGVNVEVKIYENNSDSIRAIHNGEADIIAITFAGLYQEWEKDSPYVAIVAGDYSYGADAILAKTEIKTLDDLKGKKVGVEFGTVSEFLLDFAITKRSNISIKDIKKVNLTVDESSKAFINGEIDAIVTFEPYISKITALMNANRVFDSKNERGLIVDVGMVDKNNLEENFEDFEKVVKVWFKTVDFYKKNPKEAINIMAKASGIDVEEFTQLMDGVYIMDLRDNVTAFSLGSGFESLFGNGRLIGDFYREKGTLEYVPKPQELIDDSIIKSLSNN